MAKIWFIRHGESTSNIDLPVGENHSIELTEEGRRQAAEVAQKIPVAPDLIVVSPYVRTQQTAQPVIERFPGTAQEIWQIHEFTFLATEKYVGTVRAQRSKLAKDYWESANPDHIDGEGAESFNQMVARIEAMLDLLARREEEFIVVFSHCAFLHTMKIMQEEPGLPRDEMIRRLHHTLKNERMPNCHLMQAEVRGGKVVLLDDAPEKENSSWPKPK